MTEKQILAYKKVEDRLVEVLIALKKLESACKKEDFDTVNEMRYNVANMHKKLERMFYKKK